jgi:AraC-like DNA-binding protein
MQYIENAFIAIEEITSLPVIWKGVGANVAVCNLSIQHTLHCNQFCSAVKKRKSRLLRCCKNDNEILPRKAENQISPFVNTCHAGCSEIVIPVFQYGKCVEIICSGPFRLNEKRSNVSYLEKEFNKLPLLKNNQIEKIINLLNSFQPILLKYRRSVRLSQLAKDIRDPRILEIVEKLSKHIDKKVETAYLANTVCLSPSRLFHLFKKEMNCSISEYLTSLRLEKAREMLTQTSFTIGEIMEKCGFNDQSRFCVVFKKKTGVTPLQYRRKFRQINA